MINQGKKSNSTQLLPSTIELQFRTDYYFSLLKKETKKDLLSMNTDWNSIHPEQSMSYSTFIDTLKGKHLSTNISIQTLCDFLKVPNPYMLYFEKFPEEALDYEHRLVLDILAKLHEFGKHHIYNHNGEPIDIFACATAQFGLKDVAFKEYQIVQALCEIGINYDIGISNMYSAFKSIEFVRNDVLPGGAGTKEKIFHELIIELVQKWNEILNEFDRPIQFNNDSEAPNHNEDDIEFKSELENNPRFSSYLKWEKNVSCKVAKRELESKAINNIYNLICNIAFNYKCINQTQAFLQLHGDSLLKTYPDNILKSLFDTINKKIRSGDIKLD